ncbi:MAG TPA: flagellar biosynthesis protein FlhF, partial [Gammaproteobacteria bacterium]|nr:flagellar biosynthesis protein FlhF [Gammaproteobacteria bacterium]
VAATDYDEKLFNKIPGPADKNKQQAQPAGRVPADKTGQIRQAYFGDNVPEQEPAMAPTAGGGSRVEWSQDPLLVEMREELKSLRGYMENQLNAMAWGETRRRSPSQAHVLKRALSLGLSDVTARELAAVAEGVRDNDAAWRAAVSHLSAKLPTAGEDALDEGGVIALVGPTGVGKTTTVAKLAARYALRRGVRHIALVTTDNYRVGAHEQLRTYGRLLDIPVRVVASGRELRSALDEMADKDVVLVDTAGMSQRDIRLSEQLSVLRGAGRKLKTLLVLAASTSPQSLEEAAKAFQRVRLDGCVLTKLDEAGQLGGALDTVVREQLPVVYVSDGQRVPEDLHRARAENLVSRALVLLEQGGVPIDDDSIPFLVGRAASSAH